MRYVVADFNAGTPLTFSEASCSDGSTLLLWVRRNSWGVEKDSRDRWHRPHIAPEDWDTPGWNLRMLCSGLEGAMSRGGIPAHNDYTADDLYLAAGRFALSLG